jgi:hypothetical protein
MHFKIPQSHSFVGIKYQQFAISDIMYGCFDVA